MKIMLLTVGKTNSKSLIELEKEYEQRIHHYVSYQRFDIPELKNAKSLSESQIKITEGKSILSKIEPSDTVLLLDEKGKSFDSIEFSKHLEHLQVLNTKKIIFCIGGAYGFSDEVYLRANGLLSISKMTFSHQMIRSIFLEQLYRAYTIIKGEKYHHK